MLADETIVELNVHLREIGNNSFVLSENMSDEKLVRTIMRSLPERFDMKVTTIKEAQKFSTMKVDELVVFLLTFEMLIDDISKKKSKGATFKTNTANNEDQVSHDIDKSIIESITILSNKFSNFMRILDRRFENNVSLNVKGNQQQSLTSGNF